MRPAFTLIEVLAAVAIASIAGIAMLKMNSANLFFFDKLKHYAQMQDVLSIAGLHGDVSYNRSDKTLYAILNPYYTIDNDELRRYLKSQTYRYEEQLIDTVAFDTDALADEAPDREVDMTDIQNAAAAPLIQFELIRITLRDPVKHGSILQVRTLEE